MTDRVEGFIVTLEQPMRIDDAQGIMNAIRLLYNVGSVEPSIDSPNDMMNRSIVRGELRKKLFEVL